MVEKETEKEEEIQTTVVKELPTTIARVVEDENGVKHNLVTVEEAQTEILNTLRKLEKSLIGN